MDYAGMQIINVEIELSGASCPSCQRAIDVEIQTEEARYLLETFALAHSKHSGYIWRGRITAPPMMASEQIIEIAFGGS
jgi:hypothetical protein